MKFRILTIFGICLLLFYPVLLATKIANGTFSLIIQKGCETNISNSTEASKNNGFFVSEYVPNKKFINLQDNSKITIPNAWLESNWCHSYDWLLNRTKSKGNEYKFLIEFKFDLNETLTFSLKETNKETGYYSYDPLGAFAFPRNSIDKRIQILVEQKNIQGKKEGMVVDSIEFFLAERFVD